ncbi:MAG: SpoIIE family protein phosphatase [Acidobacteria bacterium]|nr:SpoIIE family protein phosphatase [Acidobacteriota bacterium]
MTATTLKAIISPRSGGSAVFSALREHLAPGICIVDASGRCLLGDASVSSNEPHRTAVLHEGVILGYVIGASASASAIALLLTHLASRDSENRALASEVLHLYREIHLIEELSEQLAPLLGVAAVAHSALDQAKRLINATHGSILVIEKENCPVSTAASFGDSCDDISSEVSLLGPTSPVVATILQRGTGEIVNECGADPRVQDSDCPLGALICAPLRTGTRIVGVILLGDANRGASYAAADLKLLNTIALQTASAIENSFLCAEMIETARERAAFAAEFQAASSVQQLLLTSASRPTPGFNVESVYLPASEVGGDFFFVAPGDDGSLTAILGDVSGKGLTAAMRVAMILGAIRRESSQDPSDILAGLNNVLMAQGQLGFTTACCVQISRDGSFMLANAGHIAAYVSGREVTSPPSLPLGIAADQSYQPVSGKLGPEERIVLLSDGVPEARSRSGELYGFDRLGTLTCLSAKEIAEEAKAFGQEDDVTVLTISLEP